CLYLFYPILHSIQIVQYSQTMKLLFVANLVLQKQFYFSIGFLWSFLIMPDGTSVRNEFHHLHIVSKLILIDGLMDISGVIVYPLPLAICTGLLLIIREPMVTD
ncbi:hypothetical protein L9F63_007103, partial [Diploptera punctata]